MHELTGNAKNSHMDVVSKKVHAVWSSKGLHSFCKSTTGGIGYKQYMNVLDSLIVWEHDVLGFTKYNLVPKNRTFAYVNYTYYMFQGGLGVSFHVDQESRVLNCNTLINRDDDAIWAPASAPPILLLDWYDGSYQQHELLLQRHEDGLPHQRQDSAVGACT